MIIASDLSKCSFMVVMGQKPDYSGLENEWREGVIAIVSDLEMIGKRWSRVKERVDGKGDIECL